eukprot:CAMPEP_0196817104 /NCGR_PEP_ID=MMETSP1362-20130617/58784_1 /TAXON_ID=163516 /ORGANISM="Leptocylindrus danicus, Strain CCMP1856" /LENGTH=1178 /DNA_ID=CAMNT_0042194669 /DNA_START=50 /DNA_END=3586 /DNA_ORIENTATION=+
MRVPGTNTTTSMTTTQQQTTSSTKKRSTVASKSHDTSSTDPSLSNGTKIANGGNAVRTTGGASSPSSTIPAAAAQNTTTMTTTRDARKIRHAIPRNPRDIGSKAASTLRGASSSNLSSAQQRIAERDMTITHSKSSSTKSTNSRKSSTNNSASNNNNNNNNKVQNNAPQLSEEQMLFESKLCEDPEGIAIRKIDRFGKAQIRTVKCVPLLQPNQNTSRRSLASRSTGFISSTLSKTAKKKQYVNASKSATDSFYVTTLDDTQNLLNNPRNAKLATCDVIRNNRAHYALQYGSKHIIPLKAIVAVKLGRQTPRTNLNRGPGGSGCLLSLCGTQESCLDIEAPTRCDRDLFANAFALFLGVPIVSFDVEFGDASVSMLSSGNGDVSSGGGGGAAEAAAAQVTQNDKHTKSSSNDTRRKSKQTMANKSASSAPVALPKPTTSKHSSSSHRHHAGVKTHKSHSHVLSSIPHSKQSKKLSSSSQQQQPQQPPIASIGIGGASSSANHQANTSQATPSAQSASQQVTHTHSNSFSNLAAQSPPFSEDELNGADIPVPASADGATNKADRPIHHIHKASSNHNKAKIIQAIEQQEDDDISTVSSLTNHMESSSHSHHTPAHLIHHLHAQIQSLQRQLTESRSEAARAVKVAEQAIQSAEHNQNNPQHSSNANNNDWNATVTHQAAKAAALAQSRSAEAFKRMRRAEESVSLEKGRRKAVEELLEQKRRECEGLRCQVLLTCDNEEKTVTMATRLNGANNGVDDHDWTVERKWRRHLQNKYLDLRGGLRTFAYVTQNTPSVTVCGPTSLKLNAPASTEYLNMDAVVNSNLTTLYDETVAPLTQSALCGYSATIILYGSKGSVLLGDVNLRGSTGSNTASLLGLTVQKVLQGIQSRTAQGYEDVLSMSCLNVHNERLYDLLVGASGDVRAEAGSDNQNVKLDIGKNVDGDVCVPGLSDVPLKSYQDYTTALSQLTTNCENLIQSHNRHLYSQGHTLITLTIHTHNTTDDVHSIGKLTFLHVANTVDASKAKLLTEQYPHLHKSVETFEEVLISKYSSGVIPQHTKCHARHATLTHLLRDIFREESGSGGGPTKYHTSKNSHHGGSGSAKAHSVNDANSSNNNCAGYLTASHPSAKLALVFCMCGEGDEKSGEDHMMEFCRFMGRLTGGLRMSGDDVVALPDGSSSRA